MNTYDIDDEKKIALMKQYLGQYEHQKNKIAWQQQRLETIKEMAIESSPAPQDVRVQSSKLSDPTADAAVRIADMTEKTTKKIQEEQAVLIGLYDEITDALGMIENPEEREILYDVYITGAAISTAYLTWGVHPRTASRRHRKGLIDLYDAIARQAKKDA